MSTIRDEILIAAPEDKSKPLTLGEIHVNPPKYILIIHTISGRDITGYVTFLGDDYVSIVTRRDSHGSCNRHNIALAAIEDFKVSSYMGMTG